jgi:hypothetical protein
MDAMERGNVHLWFAACVGREVRISRGPLAGLEGVVRRIDGDSVLVHVLAREREVYCRVPAAWVELKVQSNAAVEGQLAMKPTSPGNRDRGADDSRRFARTVPFGNSTRRRRMNVLTNPQRVGVPTHELRRDERLCLELRLPLPPPPSVEELVRQRLGNGCPHAFYFRRVTFQFQDGVLTLRGRVPTFYLKQLLQSWLKDLDGVREIDNQVDVVSATGLSSEPRPGPAGYSPADQGSPAHSPQPRCS